MDALRTGVSLITDTGRFSLETLPNARQWVDVLDTTTEVRLSQQKMLSSVHELESRISALPAESNRILTPSRSRNFGAKVCVSALFRQVCQMR
jgi:uncharacterized small protein (DUF1192 family)